MSTTSGTGYRPTHQQQMAEDAWRLVSSLSGDKSDYLRFARQFPALIHACGLCQAITFAAVKSRTNAEHLAELLGEKKLDPFMEKVRMAPVHEYIRLNRQALAAVTWLKRYAEALLEEKDHTKGGQAHVPGVS